ALPLRRLLVGVEPISERELVRIAELRPGLLVINGYGPTETTICTTLYGVGREPRRFGNPSAPIGRPVVNSAVHLFDRWLEPAPAGVSGALRGRSGSGARLLGPTGSDGGALRARSVRRGGREGRSTVPDGRPGALAAGGESGVFGPDRPAG